MEEGKQRTEREEEETQKESESWSEIMKRKQRKMKITTVKSRYKRERIAYVGDLYREQWKLSSRINSKGWEAEEEEKKTGRIKGLANLKARTAQDDEILEEMKKRYKQFWNILNENRGKKWRAGERRKDGRRYEIINGVKMKKDVEHWTDQLEKEENDKGRTKVEGEEWIEKALDEDFAKPKRILQGLNKDIILEHQELNMEWVKEKKKWDAVTYVLCKWDSKGEEKEEKTWIKCEYCDKECRGQAGLAAHWSTAYNVWKNEKEGIDETKKKKKGWPTANKGKTERKKGWGEEGEKTNKTIKEENETCLYKATWAVEIVEHEDIMCCPYGGKEAVCAMKRINDIAREGKRCSRCCMRFGDTTGTVAKKKHENERKRRKSLIKLETGADIYPHEKIPEIKCKESKHCDWGKEKVKWLCKKHRALVGRNQDEDWREEKEEEEQEEGKNGENEKQQEEEKNYVDHIFEEMDHSVKDLNSGSENDEQNIRMGDIKEKKKERKEQEKEDREKTPNTQKKRKRKREEVEGKEEGVKESKRLKEKDQVKKNENKEKESEDDTEEKKEGKKGKTTTERVRKANNKKGHIKSDTQEHCEECGMKCKGVEGVAKHWRMMYNIWRNKWEEKSKLEKGSKEDKKKAMNMKVGKESDTCLYKVAWKKKIMEGAIESCPFGIENCDMRRKNGIIGHSRDKRLGRRCERCCVRYGETERQIIKRRNRKELKESKATTEGAEEHLKEAKRKMALHYFGNTKKRKREREGTQTNSEREGLKKKRFIENKEGNPEAEIGGKKEKPKEEKRKINLLKNKEINKIKGKKRKRRVDGMEDEQEEKGEEFEKNIYIENEKGKPEKQKKKGMRIEEVQEEDGDMDMMNDTNEKKREQSKDGRKVEKGIIEINEKKKKKKEKEKDPRRKKRRKKQKKMNRTKRGKRRGE